MKLIAIDTSTKFLCLGFYDNGAMYEYTLEVGRKLSSLLVPMLKRSIDALHWQLKDVDYFVCGLGPGSFTGVRVGVATVKGLAWSLQKKIIGVSTLDVLAQSVPATDAMAIPVIDAKRSLIYASMYRIKAKKIRRVSGYMLCGYEELRDRVNARVSLRRRSSLCFFGDALGIYREAFLGDLRGAHLMDKDYWYPQPRHLIGAALERIARKEYMSPFEIKPMYLYPKECQIRSHQKVK